MNHELRDMEDGTTPTARKYHYWRGFFIASIVYIPVIVLLLSWINKLIDASM